MLLNGCDLMTAADAVRGPAWVPAQASVTVFSRPACTIAMLEGDLDIATTPAVRDRLLRITGLDHSFTICATLDDALPAQ